MAYEGTIISRETVKSNTGFPVKLYNFKSAFDSGAFPDKRSTKQHLLDILNTELKEVSKKHAFGIGLVWGYQEKSGAPTYEKFPVRMVDMFLYSREQEWEINPEVTVQNYIDGTLDRSKALSCETSLVVLGKEGDLRRRVKQSTYQQNLEAFLESWPDVQPLGPVENDHQAKNQSTINDDKREPCP